MVKIKKRRPHVHLEIEENMFDHLSDDVEKRLNEEATENRSLKSLMLDGFRR